MHGPPPAGVTDETVADAVGNGWGVRTDSIAYVPEGGGSYHWRITAEDGTRYFVSLDDLDEKPWFGSTRPARRDGLHRALSAAMTLRAEAGLGFVVAPLASLGGEPMRLLDDRHGLAVYPYLDGVSFPFGPHEDPVRRAAVLEMLIGLHRATPHVADRATTIVPAFGERSDLDAFLADPEQPWDTGSYGDQARGLLAPVAGALRQVVAGWEALVVETSAAAPLRVVFTHGEPNGANVMSAGDGFVLIDWDTPGLAAPERDLWFLPVGTDEARRYGEATGYEPDPRLLLLYRLRWYLDDTAWLVRMFRHPHPMNGDTERWLGFVPDLVSAAGEWVKMLP